MGTPWAIHLPFEFQVILMYPCSMKRNWFLAACILCLACFPLTAQDDVIDNDRWLGQEVGKSINWLPIVTVGGIAFAVILVLVLFAIALRREVARHTTELLRRTGT